MLHEKVRFFPEKTVANEDLHGLYWITDDKGAWEGPHTDWLHHKEKILKYVKNFDCVVQAGGNLGLYPKLLSKMFKKVYTFEPDALNFYVLNLNCTESNIVKMQAGLGDVSDIISMHVQSKDNYGMHKVKLDKEGMIPLVALDSYYNIIKPDLIFLDVELYESEVLSGANQIILVHKPAIIVENPERVKEYLERDGYALVEKYLNDGIFISREE